MNLYDDPDSCDTITVTVNTIFQLSILIHILLTISRSRLYAFYYTGYLIDICAINTTGICTGIAYCVWGVWVGVCVCVCVCPFVSTVFIVYFFVL